MPSRRRKQVACPFESCPSNVSAAAPSVVSHGSFSTKRGRCHELFGTGSLNARLLALQLVAVPGKNRGDIAHGVLRTFTREDEIVNPDGEGEVSLERDACYLFARASEA
jgi:hypothetical protein